MFLFCFMFLYMRTTQKNDLICRGEQKHLRVVEKVFCRLRFISLKKIVGIKIFTKKYKNPPD